VEQKTYAARQAGYLVDSWRPSWGSRPRLLYFAAARLLKGSNFGIGVDTTVAADTLSAAASDVSGDDSI